MALQMGDALLLYGQWKKLIVLGREPDFLVLTEIAQDTPREEKAFLALSIMIAVLLPVILGWLPNSNFLNGLSGGLHNGICYTPDFEVLRAHCRDCS